MPSRQRRAFYPVQETTDNENLPTWAQEAERAPGGGLDVAMRVLEQLNHSRNLELPSKSVVIHTDLLLSPSATEIAPKAPVPVNPVINSPAQDEHLTPLREYFEQAAAELGAYDVEDPSIPQRAPVWPGTDMIGGVIPLPGRAVPRMIEIQNHDEPPPRVQDIPSGSPGPPLPDSFWEGDQLQDEIPSDPPHPFEEGDAALDDPEEQQQKEAAQNNQDQRENREHEVDDPGRRRGKEFSPSMDPLEPEKATMNPSGQDYSDQTLSRPEGLPNDSTLEEDDLSQVNLPGFPLQDILLYPSPRRHEDNNNNNSASLDATPPPPPSSRRRDESSVAIKTKAESPSVPLSGQEQTLQFNIDSFLENEPPSSVPPAPSLSIHYSLNPYPGPYNFTATIPTLTEIGLKPKWFFSPIVNKLYAAKRVTFPINIKMERFIPEASIIICPIYSISTISLPVKQCCLCEMPDAQAETKGHIIQVEGCPCKYLVKDNRCMAAVRLPMPAPGDSSSQLLVKMACNTSCVGGPNRRPFSIMLSLFIRNEEVGRQVIHTKCCESPIRDMRRDEAGIRKITPSMMQPKAKEPKAGLNEGPEKRRQKGEGSVKEKKRKKTETEIAVEQPASLHYLMVPERFRKKVKRYLNTLYMQEQCKLMKAQLKKLYPSETESD